jgi:hypothetical protein
MASLTRFVNSSRVLARVWQPAWNGSNVDTVLVSFNHDRELQNRSLQNNSGPLLKYCRLIRHLVILGITTHQSTSRNEFSLEVVVQFCSPWTTTTKRNRRHQLEVDKHHLHRNHRLSTTNFNVSRRRKKIIFFSRLMRRSFFFRGTRSSCGSALRHYYFSPPHRDHKTLIKIDRRRRRVENQSALATSWKTTNSRN